MTAILSILNFSILTFNLSSDATSERTGVIKMALRGFKPVGEEITRTLGPEGQLAQGECSSKYKVEQFNTGDGLVTKVTNPSRNRIGFFGGNISREASTGEIEKKVTTWFALDRFREGKPTVVSGP